MKYLILQVFCAESINMTVSVLVWGAIPLSVSEILAYWHIFQYWQYQYRQSKYVADMLILRDQSAIPAEVDIGTLAKIVSSHPIHVMDSKTGSLYTLENK